MIAAGAVDTGSIAAGAVTTNRMAAGAVDGGAIASGAVDTGAIASGAVTSGKIADNAVTGTQIDFGKVQSSSAIDLTTSKSATAECPAGKVLTGGGYQFFGDPANWGKIVVTDAQPLTPPNQAATKWVVEAQVISGQSLVGSVGWGIGAYGICT